MKVVLPRLSQIQELALKNRLDALGIKIDAQGNVDESSLDGLRAGKLKGADALRSVLENGFLSHQATEKLTRSKYLGLVQTGGISERDNNALKSVIMNIEGINDAFDKALNQSFFKINGDQVTVDKAGLEAVRRRIEQTLDNWNKTIGKHGFAQVSGDLVRLLRLSLRDTAELGAALMSNMSESRSALLAARSKVSGLAGMVAKPLLDSVLQSMDMIQKLQQFAEWSLIMGPAPISLYESKANELGQGALSRAGVKKLAQLLEKLDNETQLGTQELTKAFEKLVTKNFVSIRTAAALDLTVLTLEALNELWPANLAAIDKSAANGNLYAAIGAARDASPADLQKCYRLAAKMYHPDANGTRMSPEKFDRAKKAYDILSNPNKRAEYDHKNPAPQGGALYRSLLEDPSRLMAQLVKSDAVAATLKTETGLFDLFSSVALANPIDPKAFHRALDKALIEKAGEPASFSPVELEKLGETNGVIRGDYSPENMGRAIKTAFYSMDPKDNEALATRVFARAQDLIEPKGVLDHEVYAHDAKFVNTLQDLKARLGFTLQNLNAAERRYAIGNFFARLEVGNIPELPALPPSNQS